MLAKNRVEIKYGIITLGLLAGLFAAHETDEVKISPILPALIENGLLKTVASSRVRFIHLEICTYLAGSAISELMGLDAIFNRPEWSEKPAWDIRNQTMGYFLIFSGSAPQTIERYLGCDRAPLHQHLLTAARWLQGAPVNVPWRNGVMRKLVAILQVRVVEGEGTVYPPGSRSARGLVVQVSDETGRPVSGAAVSFRLPESRRTRRRPGRCC